MALTSIRNETPSKLTLVGAEDDCLVLAPLQHKVLEDISAFDLKRAEGLGLVRLAKEAPSKLGEQVSVTLFIGGFWGTIACLGISNLDPFFGLAPDTWRTAVWATGAVILALVVAAMTIRATNSLSLVARFTTQTLALTVILAIGLGLPAATIYWFGGGRGLLANPAGNPLALFGRLIELAFIATASLLPVLLFFLFDRYRLATLRSRLYANLFRLDPSVSTVGEIDARYGSQIAEAYGTEDEGRGRLAPGSRWPVLVCAIVIAIGWIIALAPVGEDFAPRTGSEALAVLAPQPTALVFGFLGVYFFSLRMIALRYARGDLKPKAYGYIVVRVFIVAVLSWVLDAVFGGQSTAVLLLAFLFGVTPDEFFTFFKEKLRRELPQSMFPDASKLPLTDLEGIDLYDRGRLESEGIVNIEGLAHHELFDLIIETRVPVPRLIDWVDQAILHLHLVGGSDIKAQTRLRDYGIRTATDLLKAWDGAKVRGDAEFNAFKRLLGGTEPPCPLEVIRDALLDDEWLDTVRCWRADVKRQPIEVDARPVTADALGRLADRQLEEGRPADAVDTLERLVRVRDDAVARRKLATVLATSPAPGLRNLDKAQQHARRALELGPGDAAELSALAAVFTATGDYDEAKRLYQAVLAVVAEWTDEDARKAEMERLEENLKSLDIRIDRKRLADTAAARSIEAASASVEAPRSG